MTLWWSWHRYTEIVWHQNIESWLFCRRRSFEWFGGVVSPIIIDNPKCAITRACFRDPEVQLGHGEGAPRCP